MKLTDDYIIKLRDEYNDWRKSQFDHCYIIPNIDYLATELLELRARLARFALESRALLDALDRLDEDILNEDGLEEIITDSIDLDWTPRTAARAIVRAMKGGE
jgi:hypothetical protein